MSSIITVTFNPCIDISITVPAMIPGAKLRSKPPCLHPGGGGINVARAIRLLGGEATALALTAGCSGMQLTGMLEKEGVDLIALETDGLTRENIMVTDASSGLQYRFIMPGPEARLPVVEDLLRVIEQQKHISYLVVSGSMPPGMPDDIFIRLTEIARRKDLRLVADISGEPLRQALASGGLFMIKPSLSELMSLAGTEREDRKENIENLAREQLQKGGCQVMVISMGAAGAMLVTQDMIKQFLPPAVKTISTVGAGDSLTAGIVLRLSQGADLEEAVRYGVACGTAATLHPGTSLCRLEDAEAIYAAMLPELIP